LHPAIQDIPASPAQLKVLHTCIKKVTEDLDHLRFNTAIAALMVFSNEALTWETRPWQVLRDFLILLQPFAPHLAEELWAKLHTMDKAPAPSLAYNPWLKFDPALLEELTIEIPVQVNGKLRGRITVPAAATQAEIEAAARACESVKPFLAGQTIKKTVYVPKKMVNLVAVAG
jgi:leucyl-tRNA synthetase